MFKTLSEKGEMFILKFFLKKGISTGISKDFKWERQEVGMGKF